MSTVFRIIAVTATVYLYTKVQRAHERWLERKGLVTPKGAEKS